MTTRDDALAAADNMARFLYVLISNEEHFAEKDGRAADQWIHYANMRLQAYLLERGKMKSKQ